jgi:NAD(P)-dependent dehydrogenase (short-subunit alcohol dehydrogenase family)
MTTPTRPVHHSAQHSVHPAPRTWLVTGTSSGFGRRITERALELGDTVAATARHPEALDDLRATYGDRLQVHALDVTDTARLRAVVDSAAADLGRIDVAVANAGYGLFGAAEELSDAEIDRQVATNLTATIQLVRAVLPHQRAQGGGRLLLVTSEGGQYAYPGFSAYHATKWGVEGFAESVAQEVAPFDISITLVEPGPTATGFAAGLSVAPASATYADTPAGATRTALLEGGFEVTGDVSRMVEHILAVSVATPAPRRLTLGRAAYDNIRGALTDRLVELEAGKHLTLSSDTGRAPDPAGA